MRGCVGVDSLLASELAEMFSTGIRAKNGEQISQAPSEEVGFGVRIAGIVGAVARCFSNVTKPRSGFLKSQLRGNPI